MNQIIKVIIAVEVDRTKPFFGTRIEDKKVIPDSVLEKIVAEDVKSILTGNKSYKDNGLNIGSVQAES